MKKLLAALAALLLCLTLTACGTGYDPYGILDDGAPAQGRPEQGEQQTVDRGEVPADSSAAEDGEYIAEEEEYVPPFGEDDGVEFYVDYGMAFVGEGEYAVISCPGYGRYIDGTVFLQLEIEAREHAPYLDIFSFEMACYLNEYQVTIPIEIYAAAPGTATVIQQPISAQMEQLGLTQDDLDGAWLGFEVYGSETGEFLESIGLGVEFYD